MTNKPAVRKPDPRRRPWTQADLFMLRTHFTDKNVRIYDLATMLDRTPQAVANKAYQLGLRRKSTDSKIIVDTYQIGGDAHLQADLFEAMSSVSITPDTPTQLPTPTPVNSSKFIHTYKMVDDIDGTFSDQPVTDEPASDAELDREDRIVTALWGFAGGVILTSLVFAAMGAL